MKPSAILDKVTAFVARDPKSAAIALLVALTGWAVAGLAFLLK